MTDPPINQPRKVTMRTIIMFLLCVLIGVVIGHNTEMKFQFKNTNENIQQCKEVISAIVQKINIIDEKIEKRK